MSKLPLVEGLLRYTNENNIPFAMPGHKGGQGFLSTDIGKEIYSNILKIDITEVDGVDNLHNPDGIIKEAEELLSRFYKSRKSYFLVNGSTSGNLAMIFSAFSEGDKVIVERNCHRSIFNGILMRKLKPIYIRNKISNKFNAPMSVDMEHFLSLIEDNKDAKGIIITYPNYYGVCPDLKFIINEAQKYNMKVLVDSAHGAHFGVHDALPESPVKLGADMVVMSCHKTLSSLTQTAYLHVGENVDIEKVDFYVSAFLSTSPSYMLMASMDYGRYWIEEYGRKGYEELIKIANIFRNKINKLKFLHVLDSDDIYNIDLSRYVINLNKGLSGHKLLEYLRSRKIQAEMSDASNVVLIFSPFNKEQDFETLYKVLSECNVELLKEEQRIIYKLHIPKAELMPWQIVDMKKRSVFINEAEGKVCGKAVVPYPPGIPLVNPGEIIDKTALDMIRYYVENKVTILGIDNEHITVVE
ncbi:aminotransferase class I/II-fold pyridoxal phosphate-dependent enzyme [Clostridium sp. YIM B02515]|uniref:Aminotransferase class I/II-fold pyridoxal phosphate-dependent enzyme n=1 Tax=Clostridium rhizosphaerae TaxID=2803861 RepID=A0ABS1T5Y5_9CLOT|nr:aminotransferase class I/II-fold pyridoxal phosphate-dependent enzyme [Clostridium rhizosphaerae]MBL4934754.1 aminotransferase class I/II-fold pyridoxal phosphate-dependent enzyme [Clostridium rhizosphaerae]